jgi:predicted DNA-binding transcriptional regulator AlpA
MCANRPDRAVREAERRQITGIPTSSWYVLQNKGFAPKPFSLTGSRSRGWSFNELTDFVEARKATRGDNWQSLGDAAARTTKKIESRR